MRVINVNNVNEAIGVAGPYLHHVGIEEYSRNGPVLVAPMPVTTVYRNPAQRVLFSSQRKTNPFFHLAESIWMLAGRDDAQFLDRYVGDFGARYAEEESPHSLAEGHTRGRLHGAYGWRWRNHYRFDQIEQIVELLHQDPTSRRAVLQIWDPDFDLNVDRRDIPCNTAVYFTLRDRYLSCTITCRSNDAVWGAYGANCVHFSVLLEYVAWRLSAFVGTMTQVSHNFHIYKSTMHLLPTTLAEIQKSIDDDAYRTGLVTAHPMFQSEAPQDLMSAMLEWVNDPLKAPRYAEVGGLFDGLLVPMERVHVALKEKDLHRAMTLTDAVLWSDWRLAAQQMVSRRIEKEDARRKAGGSV